MIDLEDGGRQLLPTLEIIKAPELSARMTSLVQAASHGLSTAPVREAVTSARITRIPAQLAAVAAPDDEDIELVPAQQPVWPPGFIDSDVAVDGQLEQVRPMHMALARAVPTQPPLALTCCCCCYWCCWCYCCSG